MRVSTWLKKQKVYRYRKELVVTVNGLRIPPSDYSTEEFNSKADAIYCERWDKEGGLDVCINKIYYDIYEKCNYNYNKGII